MEGGRLDYEVPLSTSDASYSDYVLLSLDFYNAFQFRKGTYQSDGGIHIHYPPTSS